MKKIGEALCGTVAVLALWSWLGGAAAAYVDESEVEMLLSAKQVNLSALKQKGPDVLPVLVHLYTQSDLKRKAVIAWVFYNLGWKSPDAAAVLMNDVRTQHRGLRLQVQWALGRVSDSPEVVDVLLDNMRHDQSPLFRDKAACALAYDQIHLTEEQKVRLFAGLIESLHSPNPQVRDISAKALKIHTGQTKGFAPKASPVERAKSIRTWEAWLEEYRANL